MEEFTEADARHWLDTYKAAWETADPDLAASLFQKDCTYRERRFADPMVSRDDVRKYWADRVEEHQQNITFSYQLWAMNGRWCYAGYQAAFDWLPISRRIELDGIFRLQFSGISNGLAICQSLEEWFDLREI